MYVLGIDTLYAWTPQGKNHFVILYILGVGEIVFLISHEISREGISANVACKLESHKP